MPSIFDLFNTDPAYLKASKKGLLFVAPDATEFSPKFNIIGTKNKRKAKIFDYIERDQSFVQDNGMRSPEFEMNLWFVGDDHHIVAADFERALSLRGVAELTLPLDTKLRFVIPMSFKRTNRFVDGVNRTMFEVSFHETIQPSSILKGDAKESVGFFAKILQGDAAGAFADKLSPLGSRLQATSAFSAVNGAVKKTLNFASTARRAQSGLITAWQSTVTSIDTNVSNLFEQPLILASQLQSALTLPIFPRVTNLLSAYGTLLGSQKIPLTRYDSDSKNLISIQELTGASALGAMATKVVELDYRTRQEAIDAFSAVAAQYEEFLEYLEDQQLATEELPLAQRYYPDAGVCESLQAMIQRMAGQVDAILLNTRQEIEITLDKDETPLNIVAKWYPTLFQRSASSALSFFESTNSLTADQRFVLERGTQIKVLV